MKKIMRNMFVFELRNLLHKYDVQIHATNDGSVVCRHNGQEEILEDYSIDVDSLKEMLENDA